jgi:hypothetical protein
MHAKSENIENLKKVDNFANIALWKKLNALE